MESQEIINREN